VSNPTNAGLVYDAAALCAALSDPALVHYEPSPFGLPAARRAIAEYYGTLGVDPEHVILTASSSEAYGFLFKLLADPGDTICVPQPSYPLFEFLAGLESLRVRPYALEYQRGWRIQLESLREAAQGARAIVVVSPNNPTGSFLKVSELELLRELGLPLICDEVF